MRFLRNKKGITAFGGGGEMLSARRAFIRSNGFIVILPLIVLSVLAGCAGGSTASEVKKTNAEQDRAKREAMSRYITGLEAESKEDYAGAILEFQEAVAIYPAAAIYFSLGKNYAALNKLPAALQNARMAYMLDSTNAEYGMLLQGIYADARLTDSAMTVLESVLRRDSTNIEAYYKLAMLSETAKPARAIVLYKRILSSLGFEWSVLQRLAQLYERLGDIKGCIRSLEDLAAGDPDNVDLQILLAEYYERDGSDEKASHKIDELLQFYPDNLRIVEAKAKLMLKQKDWQKAAEFYLKAFSGSGVELEDKVRISTLFFITAMKDSTALPFARRMFESIDRDTLDWQVQMYLGAIELEEGNDSLAAQYLHRAVELAPFNADAWIRLGGFYFDERKYKEAAALLADAVVKFPEEFMIRLILGLAHAEMGKYETSVLHLRKAAAQQPKDLTALSALGYNLFKVREYEEAIGILKKALGIDPSHIGIISTLGLIYDDREMWPECDSIYKAALEIDSANALIKNNYSYSLSKRGEQLEYALKLVTEALQKEPANSSYLDTKGWVYFKMREYEKARDYIQKSLDLHGDNAVVLEHLGDVYAAMGKRDDARAAYKKALELDADNTALKEKLQQ